MVDFFSQPDELGDIRQSELQSSLGERLAAQAADTLDPKNSLSGMYLFRRLREGAAGGFAPHDWDELPGMQAEELRQQIRAAIPETSITDAKARLKQEGLEGHVTLPDQPSIKSPVLDLMISEGHERRDRENAIARGPQGFVPGALGLVTSLGVGMIDPVNAAAFSIPVLGEARFGKLLAGAGDSIAARAGVRAAEGALQGAQGTALLQPADWWLHTQDGQDYTMADALKSIAMGAGMGAAFHSGIGAFGDIWARRRGDFLPGSPGDLLAQGLMTGRHIPAAALEDGVSADELIAAHDAAPTITPASHPAEVIADLPPAAQQDLLQAAIADVIHGQPVRAAEVLQVAADHDPRIAESFEAWHGSPHDFERFDVSKIGTGEGAQAYGYGLYFAEHEGVADFYREALSAPVPTTNGRVIARGDGKFDIIDDFGIQAGPFVSREQAEAAMAGGKGNVYKVSIKANRDHFLDWDKPLSEQPRARAAIEKLWSETGEPAEDWSSMTGEAAYDRLAKHVGDAASLELRDAGIPGIKYLDQRSRDFNDAYVTKPDEDGKFHVNGAGIHEAFETREQAQAALDKVISDQATRNFVVFDDKHVEITHKNGEALAKPVPVAEAAPHIPDLVKPTKSRGRAAAHPDTLSLVEHLASKGGLKPDPELEAIYGGRRGPFVPGIGPLIRKGGMSLDEALRSAKDAGYFFDPHDEQNGTAGATGRTSMGLKPRDLLDHLDAENRGRKVYKAGHLEATKYDPEQEKHVIMRALEDELEKSGADVSAIDPKLLDRTVEIVHREGVSDVMDAYERAIMEDAERYDAIAEAASNNSTLRELPGFDDGRAAPGDGGRDQANGRQAGRPEQGRGGPDDPQSRSHGARAAEAAADPRWRELADGRPDTQDPQAIAESRAADAVPEPESLVPETALSAAEKAAADAEEIWRQIEPNLTEEARASVNDALAKIGEDKTARAKIITEGAACLMAAYA